MEIIMATIKKTYIKFNNQFFKSFTSSGIPDDFGPKPSWTDDESQAAGYNQDDYSERDMLKSAIGIICTSLDISEDKLKLITKNVKIIPFENTLEF